MHAGGVTVVVVHQVTAEFREHAVQRQPCGSQLVAGRGGKGEKGGGVGTGRGRRVENEG